MKKSFLLLIVLFSIVIYFLKCQNSEDTTKTNNAQDTTLEDLLEPRPEKKVNQAPTPESKPKTSSTSDSKEKTTVGTFLLLEQDDYTYLHMKDEKNQETTFQIWAAYEGAHELNVGNWESVKGEKIKVTWEEAEETVQERGEKVKMKKLLSVKVL